MAAMYSMHVSTTQTGKSKKGKKPSQELVLEEAMGMMGSVKRFLEIKQATVRLDQRFYKDF